MSLYQKIAEKLQFLSPELYKERYFKILKNLDKTNFSQYNIEPELVWIREYMSKDSVLLDIGANVGSFLYYLENTLKPENIHAFEPNKKLFDRLKRLFPKMNMHSLALSDEDTEADFKIPVINGERKPSRGTLNTEYREKDEEKSLTERVQVEKLDTWMKKNALPRLDFIKIDVEGNEVKTLQGAKETIQKFRPTLMVEMEQRHHQKPIWDTILEVESWGYTAQYLDRNTFQLKNISEEILSQNPSDENNKTQYINNIIFIPKSSV